MARVVRRSRLVLQTTVTSKLGQVSLSGFIRHSRGVSLTQLRTFGNYALVYLLKGIGRMKSGNLPLTPCQTGDLLFVYPEIPHGYGPLPGGKLWSEFYLVFNGPVFDLWRRIGLLQPQNPIRHLPEMGLWLPRLEAIISPKIPNTAEGMLERVCRLQTFLCDIAEAAIVDPHPIPWMELAMRDLVEKPNLTPEVIAGSLGVSYETFRKEFTRRTGQPPARYRSHRLIERARALMTEGNLTNKQMAETLGFCDEFHFSRRFQQIEGRSTREFRRSLR